MQARQNDQLLLSFWNINGSSKEDKYSRWHQDCERNRISLLMLKSSLARQGASAILFSTLNCGGAQKTFNPKRGRAQNALESKYDGIKSRWNRNCGRA